MWTATMRSKDLGPANKILGQDHRILVFDYIRFEVTPSSVQSLGVPSYKVQVLHQTSPDLKAQTPNLKNPERIINISTSRPTFTVRFLGFIRSLSDISINPLFCVPGGLERGRVAECHRNIIIRPPETFAGWKPQRVSVECIRCGSGRVLWLRVYGAVCLLHTSLYTVSKLIPWVWDSQ